MTKDDEPLQHGMLATALEHLQTAIELLDEAEAPGQIAAHVDLAAHQLADALGVDPTAIVKSNGSSHSQKLAAS